MFCNLTMVHDRNMLEHKENVFIVIHQNICNKTTHLSTKIVLIYIFNILEYYINNNN